MRERERERERGGGGRLIYSFDLNDIEEVRYLYLIWLIYFCFMISLYILFIDSIVLEREGRVKKRCFTMHVIKGSFG